MLMGSGGHFCRVINGTTISVALGLGVLPHPAIGDDHPIANPAVTGSTRPGRFIGDCIAGSDFLDIVVIGDSNTGSAIVGLWGYHNGLSEALLAAGAHPYATSVYPTMRTRARCAACM